MRFPSDTGGGALPGGKRARWLRLSAAVLILGATGILLLATRGPTSPQDLAEQMRAGLPRGSTHDELRRWLENEGLGFWYYDPPYAAKPFPFAGRSLAQLVGVSAGEVGSVVFVPLPGSAGRGSRLRPYRMDVYVVLDRRGRVAGIHSRTYEQKALWERLLSLVVRSLVRGSCLSE